MWSARAAIARRHGGRDAAQAKVYTDANHSGVGPAGAGLEALLADIAAGGVDEVVVRDWARLSRSVEQALLVLDAIERAGCRLWVLREGWPPGE